MKHTRLQVLEITEPCNTIAWRGGIPIDRRTLLAHARHFAQNLPAAHFLINLCTDRYHFLVGFIGALLAGKTTLLPPNRTPRTVADLRQVYANSVLITDTEVAPATQDIKDQTAGIELNVAEDLVAAIVFTSGSTGQHQPHLKTWGSLSLGARLMEARFGLSQAPSTLVATVPPQHMYGLETSILAPLILDTAIHGGRPFYAADIQAALSTVPGPRVLITTPLHLKVCIESDLVWPTVSMIISATAPLPKVLAAAVEQAFRAPVLEIYGCSEAGSIASRRSLDGPLWQTYDGMQVVKQNGRFLVTGPHLAGPVELHDTLELASPTAFALLGRDTDLINIAGKRASLAALNGILNAMSGVEDGVFIQPDRKTPSMTRLAALVVAPTLSEQQILSCLAESLDPVFLPRPLIRVDRLPRNELGKLPRQAVLALLEQLRDSPG